jgi:hypothetical protein
VVVQRITSNSDQVDRQPLARPEKSQDSFKLPAKLPTVTLDFSQRPPINPGRLLFIDCEPQPRKDAPHIRRLAFYLDFGLAVISPNKLIAPNGFTVATHFDINNYVFCNLDQFSTPSHQVELNSAPSTQTLQSTQKHLKAYRYGPNGYFINLVEHLLTPKGATRFTQGSLSDPNSAPPVDREELKDKTLELCNIILNNSPTSKIYIVVTGEGQEFLDNFPVSLANSGIINLVDTGFIGYIPGFFEHGTGITVRVEQSGNGGTLFPNDLLQPSHLPLIERALQQLESAAGSYKELQLTGENAVTPALRLLAKLLGRLPQVIPETINHQAKVRNSLVKEPLSHLYSQESGTRYFFPDNLELDLLKLLQLPDGADEAAKTNRMTEIRNKLTMICNYFRDPSKKHAQIFLAKPDSNPPELLAETDILDKFGDLMRDLSSTADQTSNWEEFKENIKREIRGNSTYFKSISDPRFHEINPDDPLFVRLAYNTLRGRKGPVTADEDFSTPLIPLEFGYFDPDQLLEPDSPRIFRVTTEDRQLQSIARYLFSEQGANDLVSCGARISPVQADYITVYVDDSSTSDETHPNRHVADFGGSKPSPAYFIEIGKSSGERERWVLASNPCSASNLAQRRGPGIDTLKRALNKKEGPEFLAEFSRLYSKFREHQYDLFKLFVDALANDSVKLADKHRLVTVPDYDRDSPSSSTNCTLRRAVPGRRAHKTEISYWNEEHIEQAIPLLAALSAASIVAQLPILPRSDINLFTTDSNRLLLTLLSTAESFCQASGYEKASDFLIKHAPALYGNFIARWLAPLTLNASGEELETARTEQSRFIEKYAEALGKALLQIKTAQLNFTGSVKSTGDKSPSLPPSDLDIAQFLEVSEALSKLDASKINLLKQQIKRRALKELSLFREILKRAKRPNQESAGELDPKSKREIDALYTAISNLIEGYLLTPVDKRDQMMFRHSTTRIKAQLEKFEIPQITAFINLLKLNVRISELSNYREIVAYLGQNHPITGDSAANLLNTFPEINLSIRTVADCIEAIEILKAALDADDETSSALQVQLSELGSLSSLFGRELSSYLG